MSDERIRELERAWRATGDLDARQAWYRALLRQGVEEPVAQRTVFGLAQVDVVLVRNVETRAVHLGGLTYRGFAPKRRSTVCNVSFFKVETDDEGHRYGYEWGAGDRSRATCPSCKGRLRKETAMLAGSTLAKDRLAPALRGFTDQNRLSRVWGFRPWDCLQGDHDWRQSDSRLGSVFETHFTCYRCGDTSWDEEAKRLRGSAKNPRITTDEHRAELLREGM